MQRASMRHALAVNPRESAHPRAALGELAEKYRTLLLWRTQKSRDGSEPERAEFRALARRFPGALRELEVLSVETIEQRAIALEACARGEVEPALWMLAIESFHRWMRVALRIKARSSSAAPSELDEAPAEIAFIQRLRSPDTNRLRPVVIERVASELGVEASTVAHIVLQREHANTHSTAEIQPCSKLRK